MHLEFYGYENIILADQVLAETPKNKRIWLIINDIVRPKKIEN